jgi:hypothetical protein
MLNEFYKVGYHYQGKINYAVYFQLKNAQEAMLKMIQRGVNVTGLESQKIR